MRSRLLPVVSALFQLTACTGPVIRGSHLEGWHGARLADVRVVGNAGAVQVARLAEDLADFDAAFAVLLGRRLEAPGPEPTVYLIREPRLARLFALSAAAPGWALPSLEGSVTSVLLPQDPLASRRTLLHEYTHIQLWKNRRAPLPRWYNEGLADYFSTLDRRDGALLVGTVPTPRLVRVASRGAMPLDRLFEGSVQDMDWQEIGDFYATAWALTHYLLSSPAGRGELSEFRQRLEHGVPAAAARQAAFGRSSEQLSKELAIHVGYLSRGAPAEFILDERRVRASEPVRVEPLGRGEVARELGTLALRMADAGGDPALARNLLQIAAAELPGDARVAAAHSEALAKTGDVEGARASITQALGSAPGDLEVCLHAGHVALELGEADRAQALYRRALTLDPGSAPAWFGLGLALERVDEDAEALEAFLDARRFGWSSSLDFEIGRLHLAAERRSEALEFLGPLAQDPHGGEIARRAAELLEEAGLRGPEGG